LSKAEKWVAAEGGAGDGITKKRHATGSRDQGAAGNFALDPEFLEKLPFQKVLGQRSRSDGYDAAADSLWKEPQATSSLGLGLFSRRTERQTLWPVPIDLNAA